MLLIVEIRITLNFPLHLRSMKVVIRIFPQTEKLIHDQGPHLKNRYWERKWLWSRFTASKLFSLTLRQAWFADYENEDQLSRFQRCNSLRLNPLNVNQNNCLSGQYRRPWSLRVHNNSHDALLSITFQSFVTEHSITRILRYGMYIWPLC